jgi:hypothetical protein
MSFKKHAFYLILLTLISNAGAEIRYKLNSLSENSALISFQITNHSPDEECWFAFTSLPTVECTFRAVFHDSTTGITHSAKVEKRSGGLFHSNWLQWYSFKAMGDLNSSSLKGEISLHFNSPVYRTAEKEKAVIKGNVLIAPLFTPLSKTAAELPAISFTKGIRISVVKDGIYQITPSDLKDLGIPVEKIDSRTFRLFEKDREIPIYVTNSHKSRLGPDDRILFYGRALRGKNSYYEQFSNTNCYWLTWGGALGARVAEVSGQPRKDPSQYSTTGELVEARDFIDTVHLEYDNFILYLGSVADIPPDEVTDPPLTQSHVDNWYWGHIGREQLTVFNIDIPNAAASGTAKMRIGLMGVTKNDSISNDHHFRILFNNDPLGSKDTAVWDGQRFFIYESDTFSVDRFEDLNRISFISSRRDFHDYAALNWIELIYNRNFQTKENSISFKNNPNALGKVVEYELTNFGEEDLELWDIGRNRYFVDFLLSDGSGRLRNTKTLTFQDSINYETRYLAQAKKKRLTPALMVLDTIKDDWKKLAGTEYLIISSNKFREEFEPLLKVHTDLGLSTAFVDIDDIYNRFSYGIRDPESIRTFLKYLFSISGKKPPRYLLLGGDTTHDLDKTGSLNVVPTHLSRFPGWGPGADDGYFGTVWGEDNFPDICVGRFPAGNEQELRTLVDKTVKYIKNPQRGYWRDNLLLLGGGEADFTAFNNSLVNETIGSKLNVIRMDADSGSQFYRDGFTASNFIAGNINSGVFLISFNGHGGGNIWSDNNFFGYNDLPKLYNGQWGSGGRLPVVFSFTCLTGFFESNTYRSLGEEFIRTNHNGAICFYGASAYTSKTGNFLMNKLLMELALDGSFSTIGELFDFCELNMLVRYGPEYIFLVRQYNLLGDPALPWVLTPDTLDISLSRSFLESGDSLKVKANTSPVKKGNIKLTVKAGYEVWDQNISTVNKGSISRTFSVKEKAGTSNGVVRAYAWNDTAEVRGWVSFAKDTIMVHTVRLSPEKPFFGDSVLVHCRLQTGSSPVVRLLYALSEGNREDVSWLDMRMDPDSADRWVSNQKIPLTSSENVNKRLLLLFQVYASEETKQSSIFSFNIKGRPDLAFAENAIKLNWEDDSLRIKFTVLNIGNAASAPFNILLQWIRPNGFTDTIAVLKCKDSLNPGAFRSFSKAIPDTQGTLQYSGILNFDGRFTEILSGNNSVTASTHLIYSTLKGPSDTLRSAGGGLLIVPTRKFDKPRRIFLFDNPMSVAQPLLTDSRWLNLKSDSAAEMSIGSRPALSSSDTLIWIFHPDNADLNRSLKKTTAASGKLAVMQYDSQISKWRSAGGSPNASNTRFTVRTNKSGPLSLSFLTDTRVPDIELSVFGRTLNSLDYAAKDKPFSIMLSDPSEIYPGSVSISLNRKKLPPDSHSEIPFSGDLRNMLITAYPKPQRTIDSLEISLEDLAGNRASRTYAYMPGDDLSIKFLACHPNPFSVHKTPNGIKLVRFAYLLTDLADKVVLSVYTVTGKKIKTWTFHDVIGYQEQDWDGKDEDKYRIANGTYYVKLTASKGKKSVKKTIRIAKLEGY